MIYFGMEPSLNLSAKMLMCEHELCRLGGDLRPLCRETKEGYKCIRSVRGNKKTIGLYRTIEACNTAWDNHKFKRDIINLRQRLRNDGYWTTGEGESKKYVVQLFDGTHKSFANKDVARMKYEEVIDMKIKEVEAKIKPIKKSDVLS